jgi:alpha-aminoadipate/glutamate carrier protein LysW
LQIIKKYAKINRWFLYLRFLSCKRSILGAKKIFLKEQFMAKPLQIHCPECEGVIEPVEIIAGKVIVCPECGSELEVFGPDPLLLELAPMHEEDWGE